MGNSKMNSILDAIRYIIVNVVSLEPNCTRALSSKIQSIIKLIHKEINKELKNAITYLVQDTLALIPLFKYLSLKIDSLGMFIFYFC